jgi:hypothetical protein
MNTIVEFVFTVIPRNRLLDTKSGVTVTTLDECIRRVEEAALVFIKPSDKRMGSIANGFVVYFGEDVDIVAYLRPLPSDDLNICHGPFKCARDARDYCFKLQTLEPSAKWAVIKIREPLPAETFPEVAPY